MGTFLQTAEMKGDILKENTMSCNFLKTQYIFNNCYNTIYHYPFHLPLVDFYFLRHSNP